MSITELETRPAEPLVPATVKPPRAPQRSAPARFGQAGLSAGREGSIKTSLPPQAIASRSTGPEQVAELIGWFSVVLGGVELFAAQPIARWLGMESKAELVRAYGVREIVTGLVILSAQQPATQACGIRARVAGDALDLATLACGLSRDNPHRGRVAATMGLVGAVTLADIAGATLVSQR